ncbi:hypothetical protein EVA_08474 [gut metagenome]|uniref:Uncharacterized protein n=1 Tax=gut metagenome TaxID=749906 RepID=J9CT78_9ZZZZ
MTTPPRLSPSTLPVSLTLSWPAVLTARRKLLKRLTKNSSKSKQKPKKRPLPNMTGLAGMIRQAAH